MSEHGSNPLVFREYGYEDSSRRTIIEADYTDMYIVPQWAMSVKSCFQKRTLFCQHLCKQPVFVSHASCQKH